MWQVLLCASLLFLLFEIFVPSVFFVNFALSAFICAGLSLYIHSIPVLIVIFCVIAILSLLTLRPYLLTKNVKKDIQSGIEAKYIGKTAKVVERITKNQGVISIYDERWQARSCDDNEIEVGTVVEIISNESLIMQVKKCD